MYSKGVILHPDSCISVVSVIGVQSQTKARISMVGSPQLKDWRSTIFRPSKLILSCFSKHTQKQPKIGRHTYDSFSWFYLKFPSSLLFAIARRRQIAASCTCSCHVTRIWLIWRSQLSARFFYFYLFLMFTTRRVWGLVAAEQKGVGRHWCSGMRYRERF